MRFASATCILILLLGICADGHARKKRRTDATRLAAGNNAFALDLYRVVAKKPGNRFFSPASISMALALTFAGARGDTAKELAKALHFRMPLKRLHRAFGRALKRLNAKGRGWTLSTANRLWGQKKEKFLPAFLALSKRHYGAGLAQLDFAGDPGGAVSAINTWIEDNTDGKITDMIPVGSVDAETALILTNAIHFRGLWARPFDPVDTTEQPFRTSATASVQGMFMRMRGRFPMHDPQGLQILKMPYKGKHLSMLVLLPEELDGLPDLEAGITQQKLDAWVRHLRIRKVIVEVPRFRLTDEIDLKEALAALGVSQAFTMLADFSGMNGAQSLYLTAAIHKATVRVDEKGTEAAASTTVVVKKKNGGPEVFRADHPFLFLVRDDRDGAILFIGRVVDPSA